jgi:hypothetical protein
MWWTKPGDSWRVTDPAPFRPEDIVAVLEDHGVEYVVIGGFAATVHGSPHITRDVDITPSAVPDNLERLSAALRELQARVRTADVPEGVAFDHDAASLAQVQMWNLVTRAGDLDISLVPSGTTGYDDLRRDAVTVEIHGRRMRVASLADVIRSKEAAGRPKDRLALPVLRRILEEAMRRPG